MNATSPSKTFRGAVVYFALVFSTGFLLGSIRVPFIVPRIGERYAELAEIPLMFIVIFFASRYVLRRYGQKTSDAVGLIAMGVIALLLLVGSELLLAVLLAGREVIEYIASRDNVSGSVYLAMLVLFAAMPWLQARKRNNALPAASDA